MSILFTRSTVFGILTTVEIESLVIELRTSKELDNGKLLLDVLPRSALGYEFDIVTVRKYISCRFYKSDCMIH